MRSSDRMDGTKREREEIEGRTMFPFDQVDKRRVDIDTEREERGQAWIRVFRTVRTSGTNLHHSAVSRWKKKYEKLKK